MHFTRRILILLLVMLIELPTLCVSIVTNDNSWGGRFGDQLMIYYRAKWISYKNELPFYLQSFMYSNELVLDMAEKKLSKKISNNYKNKKIILGKSQTNFEINRDGNYLYLIKFYVKVNINWDDVKFVDELKRLVKPKKEFNYDIPSNCISVAVHVRRGGGYDSPLLSGGHRKGKRKNFADVQWPTKFPPDSFYIDSIKKSPRYLIIKTFMFTFLQTI